MKTNQPIKSSLKKANLIFLCIIIVQIAYILLGGFLFIKTDIRDDEEMIIYGIIFILFILVFLAGNSYFNYYKFAHTEQDNYLLKALKSESAYSTMMCLILSVIFVIYLLVEE